MSMRGARHGSYFFVIDAFVASSIFIITIVMVLNLALSPRPSAQSFSYASDYLAFISTTQLRDFDAPAVQNLSASGNISDLRATIAQQVLIFHNQSRDDLVYRLLNGTTNIIPANVAVNFTLREANGTYVGLYEKGLINVQNKPTHLAVAQVTYALINDSAMYGPVVLKVEVWS